MKRIVLMTAALASLALVSGCKNDGRSLKQASPDQSLSIVVVTEPTTTLPSSEVDAIETLPAGTSATDLSLSGSWLNGAPLPPDSTCKGKGLSPDLKWSNVPADATELVITVTDADKSGFVHWILAGIDPATPGLAQGKLPRGTVETLNSSPTLGWFAPCPVQGSHRYIFSLFVLTKPSGILKGMDPTDALAGLNVPGNTHVSITGTAHA